MAAPNPILVLDQIAKSFGDTVALHPTDLAIEKGEFIALMGPSGCGKTTTLRLIAGLDYASAGRMLMWGADDITATPPWKRDMPMVWQSYALFPFLSVRENVEFGLKQKRRLVSRDRRTRALEWLDKLGIADLAERSIHQLSGGQRQRVAIARALALQPEILLLDEPLSALDANRRLHMQSELKRLHSELGITFLYVTHNQSEAFAMADRVVILSDGRVQQIGAPKEVYRAPANRFVAEFVGANTILDGTMTSSGKVETPMGTFGIARGTPPAAHAGASLLVPADRVALSGGASGAANEVTGEILTEEFTGSFVTIMLRLSDGTEMKVQKQQSEIDGLDLTPGARICASWPAEVGYVLPRDSGAGHRVSN